MAERLSDKSPDAFRTISEVADHLDLPQHVLRFWETKFPEIRPVKRAGGRRFYRPEDVDLLRAIRHLLYTDGYTIKGVQKVLKDQGVRAVQGVGADLLDGRPVEDLRPPAPAKSAPPATPKGVPQPGTQASGGARGLLGGLLPRRREAKPDADFFSDSEPPFAHEPYGEPDGLFSVPSREDPSRPRAAEVREPRGVRLERDGWSVEEGRGEMSPPVRSREARPAPRVAAPPPEPRADEPGLPFEDLETDFDAYPFRPERADPTPVRAPAAAPRHPMSLAAEDPSWRAAPVPTAPMPTAPMPAAPAEARRAEAPPAPPVRRPSRGPASRIPEPTPVPELEDPLLPFFDDEIMESGDDAISEPLDARIRRLKEHNVEEPILRRRVGPLTGPFEDDAPDEIESPRESAGWDEREAYSPPEPRRQGPPEQYLPPHLRSEPRMSAAPAHPPQPVLSRDDMHRLQAALYELGECRRLLTSTLDP